ncbi:unnamed protein product, partial [Larinioides sclopetarius]
MPESTAPTLLSKAGPKMRYCSVEWGSLPKQTSAFSFILRNIFFILYVSNSSVKRKLSTFPWLCEKI